MTGVGEIEMRLTNLARVCFDMAAHLRCGSDLQEPTEANRVRACKWERTGRAVLKARDAAKDDRL